MLTDANFPHAATVFAAGWRNSLTQMEPPMTPSQVFSPAGRRFATLLATIMIVAGCGNPAVPVVREGDTPQPYMQFSVIVDRANGSLGPAQASADAICADVLQSAVMYIAADVGDDQTQYHFRCR